MALATIDDVAVRSRDTIPEEDRPRIEALLRDATGLIEDYCRRDLYRREGSTISLSPSGCATLPIPPRYSTALLVSAASVDGQEVTDWSRQGLSLYREAGWGDQMVTLTASWGYSPVPDSLTGIVCAEVIRWQGLTPGASSERVGEVEITFDTPSSAHSLSYSTRDALRPYRRMAAGTLTLRREGSHVFR